MSRNHFHPIFSLSQFFRRALIDKISFWPHWKKAFNSYRANDDWTGEHQLKGKYHCHCDQMARLLDQYFNIYINETLRKVGLFFCQMLYKLSKCPKTFNILPKGRIAKSGQSDHFTTDLLFILIGLTFMLNEQQFYLLGQIQTSQTGGQPYSDTSPLWWVFSVSTITWSYLILR